ncbi:45500_t:CDS:2, partial [Gigaspora margarita]
MDISDSCSLHMEEIMSKMLKRVVASYSSGTRDLCEQLLKRIADSLDNSNGTLIVEIRHVIEELQRITVLWEKLWLNKISGLQLNKSLCYYETSNYVYCRLYNSTIAGSSKQHEKWFCQTF